MWSCWWCDRADDVDGFGNDVDCYFDQDEGGVGDDGDDGGDDDGDDVHAGGNGESVDDDVENVGDDDGGDCYDDYCDDDGDDIA